MLAIFLTISSCSERRKTNELDSDEFKTKAERIEILKNAIISQSEFENAEFELFNVNGFSNSRLTVPGSSSLDYKFVIKIETEDIYKWTKEMNKVQSKDLKFDWTKEITEKRKNQWTTQSSPEFYNRGNENLVMIVYRPEGIIYKRVINE
tara:strand:- start:445 stop:894 length:450 start_codon:yes stop_codon:yes gene_type:complete